MRTGKLAAQIAHASVMAVTESIEHIWVQEWLNDQHYRKIVVGVDSEAELIALLTAVSEYNYGNLDANHIHIPAFLVTDLGLTEFKGVATKTALCIGPGPAELIDIFTRHLTLL